MGLVVVVVVVGLVVVVVVVVGFGVEVVAVPLHIPISSGSACVQSEVLRLKSTLLPESK